MPACVSNAALIFYSPENEFAVENVALALERENIDDIAI